MSQSHSYITIDPMIMETLNLNQRRIHRIFDILHGRNPDQIPLRNVVTHRHRMSSPVRQYHSSQKSIVQVESHNLPVIKITRGRNSQFNKYQMPKLIQNKKSLRSRGSSLLEQTEQIIEQNSKQNKLQYKFSRSIQRALSPKNDKSDLRVENMQQNRLRKNEQEQNRVRKNEQVVKDYIDPKSKAQRSKSAEINTKDIYRLQIQSYIAELTPIDQLQECQRKMRRLKRRHNHLKTFDRRYFSKLNQQEFNKLI